MNAQMLRLIFCLLTTIFLSVTVAQDGDPPPPSPPLPVGNQQLQEYFEPTKLVDLRWEHPNTMEEFISSTLNTDIHMITLDVDDSGKVYNTKKINDILLSFLENRKNDTENKKGLVYMFQSDTAFKQGAIPYPYTRNLTISLAPFPQWFHFNTNHLDGVKDHYVLSKEYFDYYTFSFETENEWENDDITNINNDFAMENKNYFISSGTTSSLEFCDIETKTLVTIQHDVTKDIKCISQKIKEVYGECDNKVLLNMQPNLKTQSAMCHKIIHMIDENKLSETTWRLLDDFAKLNEDIKEDIIKVDIEGNNVDTLFLGQNFKTFIDKFYNISFKDEHATKGLQLYFKTEEAFSVFLNMDLPYSFFDKFKKLRIGIKFNQGLWAKTTWKDLNILNKIISCYTVSLSAENGSKPYTQEDIDNLNDELGKIKEVISRCDNSQRSGPAKILLSLDLKRISTADDDLISDIGNSFEGVELSLTDTKQSMTKEETRNFMRKLQEQSSQIYFEYDTDEQQTVLQNVLMTDLMPELEEDLKLLDFVVVRTKSELITALEDEKRMIELLHVKRESCTEDECSIIIGDDIELCYLLEEVGKYSQNGIKLKFDDKNVLHLTLNQNCFRLLNFPVWLEIVVPTGENDEDGFIDLLNPCLPNPQPSEYCIIDDLKTHGHKVILYPTKMETKEDATRLINQRKAITDIIDVGFNIKATDLVANGEAVKNIFKIFDAEMVLTYSSVDNLIAKDVRKNLKSLDHYYANTDDKLILESCPEIESKRISANDFKNIQIADFTNGDKNYLVDLVEYFQMIRVVVTRQGNNLYVDESNKMSLSNFLEIFDTVVNKESKTGIIFSFYDNIAYTKTMRVPEMKVYNHPIWFELNIPSPTSARKSFDLEYLKFNDKLDCRTLLLRIEAKNKYTQGDINELKKYRETGNARVHAFDMDVLDKTENIEILKNVENVLLQAGKNTVLNTEEIRGKLKDFKKSDVAIDFSGSRKFAARDCPKNNDVFNYFTELNKEDLSDFTLSNYITSLNNIQSAIADRNHMLNTLLTTQGSTVIVSKDLSLLQLLKNIASLPSDKKIGLKLEFETTESFEAAVNDPFILYYIKTLERPIWISAKVIGDKNVELNHPMNNDILDCRTLSLGWTGSGNSKYSKENLEAMKNLPMGTNNKLYNVDMIHLVENFENIKKILLTKPSSTPGRTKPLKEEATELNGNKLMVSITQNEISKLEVAGLNELLNEYKEILFFDMTFEVKKQVFSGAKSLNSGLFMILALSLGLMMINH